MKFQKGQIAWNKDKKLPQFSGKNNPHWKGGLIKKKCFICDKEFYIKPCFIKTGRGRFCSMQCKWISQKRKHLTPKLKKKFLEGGIKYWETHKRPKDFGKRMAEFQRGKFREQAKGWKGGKRIDKQGYVWIITSDFYITKDGKKKSKYIKEHRFIMKKHLGRKLEKFETIHHKNGNKGDNRIENLEILIRKTHFGQIRCPHCLKEFLIK